MQNIQYISMNMHMPCAFLCYIMVFIMWISNTSLSSNYLAMRKSTDCPCVSKRNLMDTRGFIVRISYEHMAQQNVIWLLSFSFNQICPNCIVCFICANVTPYSILFTEIDAGVVSEVYTNMITYTIAITPKCETSFYATKTVMAFPFSPTVRWNI